MGPPRQAFQFVLSSPPNCPNRPNCPNHVTWTGPAGAVEAVFAAGCSASLAAAQTPTPPGHPRRPCTRPHQADRLAAFGAHKLSQDSVGPWQRSKSSKPSVPQFEGRATGHDMLQTAKTYKSMRRMRSNGARCGLGG